MPPAAQVREALERVLSSEVFVRSERARDLLRYLVEQDLAGNADRLKGYSIAVDVLGKDETFDPATDTVVRVQAGRLRDLLKQYYAGEGSADPVRIRVPRGSYVPGYAVADQGAASFDEELVPDTSPPDVPPTVNPSTRLQRNRYRPYIYGVSVVVAVLAAMFAISQSSPWVARSGDTAFAKSTSAAVNAPEGMQPQAVRDFLPAIYLKLIGRGEETERFAGILRRGLSSFDTVTFMAREPAQSAQEAPSKADFVFLLDGGPENDVHVELQNIVSGKVLFSRNFKVDGRSSDELEDDVAGLLTTVTPVSGVIYASVAEDRAETELIRCLILNELYYRDPKATAHQQAYECLEGIVAGDVKSSLAYSELAGLHMQALAARYRYLGDASEEQALALARMAIQLSPNSPYAHRSMGYVLSRSSTPDEAMRWTRKAYELNMFDLGVAASYGYELVFDGLYDDGIPILRRAVNAASAHPPWWDYGLALAQFMRGEIQSAANVAAALSASKRAHYRALRLVLAHELGQADQVETLLSQLREDNPNFTSDPRAFFERGGYPKDMSERLMRVLNEAGLVDAM